MLEVWNPYPLPQLPAPLSRLGELAYNLWWSWNKDAVDLFARLHPTLWDAVEHNPIRLLRRVSVGRLESRSRDSEYLAHLNRVLGRFDAEMAAGDSWWPEPGGGVAYLSAEFGLHESLPVYSGGLGVLAGDVCKAASDMGLPLIGVGLLYPQGYFRQRVDDQGHQHATYNKLVLADAPVRPAIVNGRILLVEVEIAARTTRAQVWWVQVGRVPLFLLDTDIASNLPVDREVGYKLYGGGPGNRLRQEMILGIGGVRAVEALGFEPDLWHLNEGHASFATVELARRRVAAGASFEAAQEAVANQVVFTTHTPVKAGHDEFEPDYIKAHFDGFPARLGLSETAFVDLARTDGHFSMTRLAFAMSRRANAVSERHGEVSREMWAPLWPDRGPGEVPITSVTNGVHLPSWMAPEIAALLESAGPRVDSLDVEALHRAVDAVDPLVLWQVHQGLRSRMIDEVRQREAWRRDHLEHTDAEVQAVDALLDPDILTVVWARRFATYKRARLIFRDPDRLAAILNHPDRPVQILFSGKAHPADQPGQAMLADVFRLTQDDRFRGRVVFAEGYDIALARRLVRGADVWLNTPTVPQEASGTSGEKAALNGVPHLSVADGWWAEGHTGQNGWILGDGGPHVGDASDLREVNDFYRLMEEEVVPAFYERDAGVPTRWTALMKGSIKGALPRFTARRMLRDYMDRMYAPALE